MSGPAVATRGPSALVVVGASAGGVEALRALVAGLPADFEAAVLVVLHVARDATSALPAILCRSGPLPARHAVDGEPLLAGRVLVAPADRHLVVSDGLVRLSRGPTENGFRPAVDPLFRTAARAWRERTIAVVLSGTRDDGTSGASAVADLGGTVIVQDPDEALYASMPMSARDHVPSAVVLSTTIMGETIRKAVSTLGPVLSGPVPDASAQSDLLARETTTAIRSDFTADLAANETGAVPAGLGCPSCHGPLFELPGKPAPRFRCGIGHAWTAETLLDEQSEAMESALLMALRSLEEKASLSRRMAVAIRERGGCLAAERYDAAGADNEQAGRLIRRLVDRLGGVVTGTPDVEDVP
jgi:two-component system chemotaxis response regulator CheB